MTMRRKKKQKKKGNKMFNQAKKLFEGPSKQGLLMLFAYFLLLDDDLCPLKHFFNSPSVIPI